MNIFGRAAALRKKIRRIATILKSFADVTSLQEEGDVVVVGYFKVRVHAMPIRTNAWSDSVRPYVALGVASSSHPPAAMSSTALLLTLLVSYSLNHTYGMDSQPHENECVCSSARHQHRLCETRTV